MGASDFILEGLLDSPQQLLALVAAQGVALVDREQITSIGISPTQTEIQALLPLVASKLETNYLYHTTSLSELSPDAVEFKDRACGMLALSISRSREIYLLWFRAELVQTIDWAGKPQKTERVAEDGTLYLTPRQSFARWSDRVYLHCAPWQEIEIAAAIELRSNIVGLVLQKADELAGTNLELARSNQDLSAFAYAASHDLKAPLRAVANLACWLQDDLADKLSAENQEYFDKIQSRLYRMDELIDGLIEYSAIGRRNNLAKEVVLTELLQDVVDSLAPPATFEITFPTTAQLVLTTYKVLLQQVLANLISNAIKYVDRPDAKIEIEVEDRDNWLRFEVRDNGPGIAPEFHHKIFQIFQTLQSRDRFESTGIGLAIVKKIVESQGGTISLDSDLGRGCNFSFTWSKLTP